MGGEDVCHYRTPEPTEGNKKCYCRTMVCKVITREDPTWTLANPTQGTGIKSTSCNFIVRIEDAHGSPKVPGYAMRYLFGIAAAIAFSTSAFFMVKYGSELKPHGH